MRFNPIEFFYELLSGNPYVIGVFVIAIIISIFPNSLYYFIADIPNKVKKLFKGKPVQHSPSNYNSDFVPADNNYFTFKGRLARGAFIKRTLLAYAGVAVVVFFCCWLAGSTDKVKEGSAYTILMFVLLIPLTIVIYASMNRRIHDIGKSSKWTWIMFFASNTVQPLYFIALLYLFCKKGNESSNEYGPNPLQ